MAGAGRNRHAIDLLLSAGALSKEAHKALLERVKQGPHRGEELLLDDGTFDELNLLRKLAALHRTQFVTSERLIRFDVPPFTLGLIPKRLAETELVFPVSWDAKSGTLQLVTPDPGQLELIDAVKLASNAREVKTFLARPRAVTALIAKHYDKDRDAFAALEREWATSRGGGGGNQFLADGTMVLSDRSSGRLDAPSSSVTSIPDAPSSSTLDSEPDLTGDLVAALVAHAESGRAELRDHSAHVARRVRQVAVRLGLSPERIGELVLAAQLHDLGKHGPAHKPHHLTMLSCQASRELRERAAEELSAPLRIVEAVDLPHGTRTAILQMYERFGGGGVPGKTQATDISLGARILTVADSFCDLVRNPGNPYGRVVPPEAACSVLVKASGSLFDETVVSALRASLTDRAK